MEPQQQQILRPWTCRGMGLAPGINEASQPYGTASLSDSYLYRLEPIAMRYCYQNDLAYKHVNYLRPSLGTSSSNGNH